MAPPDVLTMLKGMRIAVPESRQLDILDGLFTRRGAQVFRCPLVSIIDAPDPDPILAWLYKFIADPPDYFVILTGEGLARLRGFSVTGGISEQELQHSLERTTIISRGPKPARELRRFGLVPDLFAAAPTTHGVIELLENMSIENCTVAVQLYGDDPNETLIQYLQNRTCEISSVSPYRYAAELSRDGIAELVSKLAGGEMDAIVFTSKAQIERLFMAATESGHLDALRGGLAQTCVAAIGPVVVSALEDKGCRADVMPEERYFMKPLVQALTVALRKVRRDRRKLRLA